VKAALQLTPEQEKLWPPVENAIRANAAAAGGQATPGARPPRRGGYDGLADLVARKVAISADGVRCEPVPGMVTPPSPDRANAVVTVDYACRGTPRELALRDDLSDALGRDYHTIVRVEALGSVQQYTLESDRREARVGVRGSARPGTARPRSLRR